MTEPRTTAEAASPTGERLSAISEGAPHDVAVDRPRVVLGVGGGIAAYKACELLRRFTESGHDVTVVPTASALQFVGAPTWSALSGKPVSDRVWDRVHEVPHVRIGQQADSTPRRRRHMRRASSMRACISTCAPPRMSPGHAMLASAEIA